MTTLVAYAEPEAATATVIVPAVGMMVVALRRDGIVLDQQYARRATTITLARDIVDLSATERRTILPRHI
jgi:hypothetical protein